jgi:endonuclease YncB( thermonuclease family)
MARSILGRGSAVTALVLGAASLLLVAAPEPIEAVGADRDCADFSTQADAQGFFISAGGPGSDPHRLDGDGDGVACEDLPCPCSSSSSPGGGGGGSAKPKRAKQLRLKGQVADIVDGDTIDVQISGRGTERIRLIGIDTPEVYGGEECGGREASEHMARIGLNAMVRLATDPTQDRRDRYGRLLAYARALGPGSLQVAMLRAGWASVYVYDNTPFRKVKRFRKAEAGARQAGRGAWGLCGSPN